MPILHLRLPRPLLALLACSTAMGLPLPAAASTITDSAGPNPCTTPSPGEPRPLLDLEKALARVECHPLVRAARARLQGTRADEIAAGQRPNPALTVGANSIPRNGGGNGSFLDKAFDHQLRVDQAIERGGKRELRLRAARFQQQAASADVEQAFVDSRIDVTSAFLDLQTAQARVQALQAFVELNTQALQLLDRRVKAGDAPAMDLARLQADDARIRSEAAQATAEAAALRARLALALGVDADVAAWTSVTGVATYTTRDSELEPLLERRGDVRAARQRSEAAREALRLAQSQRTRDVVVGVQANRYPATPVNPSGSGNTLSLSATVPLFTAHAYEGEIARAQADLELAQLDEAQVRAAARATTEQLMGERRAAQARLKVIDEQLMPAAQRLADAAEAAYTRGGTGMLELLDARRALRAARLELITAQTQAARAEWHWRFLTAIAP